MQPHTQLSFYLLRGFAVAVLAFVFFLDGAAQNFQANVRSNEVVQGTIFEVGFKLDNEGGRRMVAPRFKGFKVVGGPNIVSGISMINGKVTANQRWVYELEAIKTGVFQIGSATISLNGKQLTTQPLQITVIPATSPKGLSAASSGSDDRLFITSEFDKNEVYLGEQVTWRIKVYTQLNIESADIIALPDFKGFYGRDKRRFDTKVQYQTLKGKKYAVKMLHEEALFPQETGDLVLEKAKIRIGVEQGGTFGQLMGPKPVVLETVPTTLKVNALPVPVPEGFTGAVGKYDWDVAVDSLQVTTDGAITIIVVFKGNGDSRRFTPPKLNLGAGLEVFEPKVKEEEEYESVDEILHNKTMEYIVLPKEPGDYPLCPVFVFFDPDSNRYRTLAMTQPDTLRVTAGKNYQPPVAAQEDVPIPNSELDQSTTGFFATPWLWLLVAIPFLGLFAFLWYKKQRPALSYSGTGNRQTSMQAAYKPQSVPTEKPRKPESLKTVAVSQPFSDNTQTLVATRRLLNDGVPRPFYEALFKVLQNTLAHRLGIAPAQMTQEHVRRRLSDQGASAATIQQVLALWQTCEQALYAGQSQSAQMEHSYGVMVGLLDVL